MHKTSPTAANDNQANSTKSISIADHSTSLEGAHPFRLSDLPAYPSALLLQGPLGPFFSKLSDHLKGRGSNVYKVNFNSGDDFFYPPDNQNVIQFRHRLEFWPTFAHDFLLEKQIKAVFLFGDCRPIHRTIKTFCKSYCIDLWVFEEGYFRPHLFTLEKGGVNFFSAITNTPIETIVQKGGSAHATIKLNEGYGNGYWSMVRFGTIYWFINLLLKRNYSNYSHHRNLNIKRGVDWTKSFFCYWLYRAKEKPLKEKVLRKRVFSSKKSAYFLLPLQVYDDSQLTVHSDYETVEQVLEEVISSFAKHILKTSASDVLIIKHHPMDRGHVNYQSIINRLGLLLNIQKHLVYLHDFRLPDIFPVLNGCITVNSTFGLQALSYGVPTINLGRSFYDKPGITAQVCLDEFWGNTTPVNRDLVQIFKNYIICHSQVNGSLYDPSYVIN